MKYSIAPVALLCFTACVVTGMGYREEGKALTGDEKDKLKCLPGHGAPNN